MTRPIEGGGRKAHLAWMLLRLIVAVRTQQLEKVRIAAVRTLHLEMAGLVAGKMLRLEKVRIAAVRTQRLEMLGPAPRTMPLPIAQTIRNRPAEASKGSSAVCSAMIPGRRSKPGMAPRIWTDQRIRRWKLRMNWASPASRRRSLRNPVPETRQQTTRSKKRIFQEILPPPVLQARNQKIPKEAAHPSRPEQRRLVKIIQGQIIRERIIQLRIPARDREPVKTAEASHRIWRPRTSWGAQTQDKGHRGFLPDYLEMMKSLRSRSTVRKLVNNSSRSSLLPSKPPPSSPLPRRPKLVRKRILQASPRTLCNRNGTMNALIPWSSRLRIGRAMTRYRNRLRIPRIH
ncbi:hypothetical protein ACFSQ7_18140 [Paenibacillus rhizoplanae]